MVNLIESGNAVTHGQSVTVIHRDGPKVIKAAY
jgi:hypothetical protein